MDLTRDELVKELFHALDCEVLYCINNKYIISEHSVELLKSCQALLHGESKALKILKERAD